MRGTVLLLGLLVATSVPARGQVEATVTPLRTPGSSVAVRLDLRERIHLCHAEGLTPCGVHETLHHAWITGGLEFRW